LGAGGMQGEELKKYLLLLWNRSWVIMLTAVLAASAAGIISVYVLQPEYDTYTTLIVGRPQNYDNGINYSDVLLNEKLVTTYGEIIKSKTVLNEVTDNMNLNITYKDFKKKIRVDLVSETEIIKIVVRDRNPGLAADIANEIATVFLRVIKEILNIQNVQIVDIAEVPDEPVRPRPLLNTILSGILGIMLSVFFVLFHDYLDNSIKTANDIENHIKIPVIGRIPLVHKNMVMEDEKYGRVFIFSEPKSIISEAIRTLRTNIQFLNASKKIKSIVLTSPGTGEGKSTIAVNLAVSMAQLKKKVLLVDCDLRNPTIHMYFGIPHMAGLTSLLCDNGDHRDLIEHTGIDMLYVLPSGPIPPNPAELLSTYRFTEFCEDIVQEYDMVIFDTSPIGLVSDASVISAIADGVVLVCAIKKSTIVSVEYAKSVLSDISKRLLGVVVNNIPLKKSMYYGNVYYD
jgi:succinoglycan biosynthesis transport protein ExoP